MRLLGNVLIVLSLLFLVYIFGPVLKVESKYMLDNALNVRYSVDIEEEGSFEKPLAIPNLDFSVVIPKIGATSTIIQNVNVDNKIEFQKQLKWGVVMAADSQLPGLPGNVSLYAHTTDSKFIARYNPVFYLLGKLKPGNEILIYYQGREFKYSVLEVKTMDPIIAHNTDNVGGVSTLTIQTNYPAGMGFKKLIVTAAQTKEDVQGASNESVQLKLVPTKTQATSTDNSEFVYPGSVVSTLSKTNLTITSTDDPTKITTWYENKIKSEGYNASSFAKTNTNGNVLNKLAGGGIAGKIEVEIKKDSGDKFTKINISLDNN